MVYWPTTTWHSILIWMATKNNKFSDMYSPSSTIKVNRFLLWNFNEKDWTAQNLKTSTSFFSLLPSALHCTVTKVNSSLVWNVIEKDWTALLKISKPPHFFSFLHTALHRDNGSRFPKLSLSRLCSKARFISCTDSIMKLYIY